MCLRASSFETGGGLFEALFGDQLPGLREAAGRRREQPHRGQHRDERQQLAQPLR
jgi:hypothetical protein